jgi:diaminopimelate decarboxylase
LTVSVETLTFLTEQQVLELRAEFGTPTFVYDQQTIEKQAREVLAFPNAYGLTARYAMKALPTAAILRVFEELGLHIDAGSGFEAERALRAGIPPERIQITGQELPRNLAELLDQGVLFTACSLHQLRHLGRLRPGARVCIRINPGLGSGHTQRTNVGGPAAGFGIWHEHLDQVLAVQREYGLYIARMHTHIGSGADPEVWKRCALLSLGIAARLPEVNTLSLGGGFMAGRMASEVSADLQAIGRPIAIAFEDFHRRHGRKLHIEIEPGTYLVANAGALICTVIDVVDTGASGYTFIKVDGGMTEVLRPSMYGAQHPIVVVPATTEARPMKEYMVVGHCCESGDLLTPKPGDPEGLQSRLLTEARIGDALVVGGAGAYCSAMSAKNYNSFLEAPEVLIRRDGSWRLIRKRQSLDHLLTNEILG